MIIANLYNNLGIVNYNMGNNQKAIGYYTESLRNSRSIDDKKIISLALHNLGVVYLSNKENDKALAYFFQSLEIKANELIKNAYEGLFGIYVKTNAPDSALRYQGLYYQLKDSIYSIESKDRINELQNKYAFERKENEIKLLRAENEIRDIKLKESRTWLAILVAGISTALIFLILILVQMTQKTRANKELVKKNREIVKSEKYIRECLKAEQQKKHLPKQQIPEDKYAGSSLSDDQKTELQLLIAKAMENRKPYLKSNFTIDVFAKQLKVSRTYISQVINEKFNMNFNAFINEYRVKEARRMLTNDPNRNLTIESIAQAVGFGSKSSFNFAFKKYTGITPSFYIKSL